jgi:hypothetical protein
MITLLEHWNAVFHGKDVWGSPRFFHPLTGILGNTDAHALLAIPYTVSRLFMNEYTSYETTQIVGRGVGYCFMALFLRRCLRLDHVPAILGASIFTIMSPSYVHMVHAQFVNAGYLPVLMLLGFVFCRATDRRHLWLSGLGVAILFPLLALSSFYLAYFAAIFVMILLPVSLVVACARMGIGGLAGRLQAWSEPRIMPLAAMSVVFVIGFIPWLVLYLPKIGGSGAFSAAAALADSQTPGDIINAGDGNWLWGWALGPQTRSWMTSNPGFPLLFVILVGGTIVASVLRLTRSAPRELDLVVVAAGCAAALFWLLLARFGGSSLWTSLYGVVPGTAAMRVPARSPLFITAVLVPIAMVGFQDLLRALRTRLSSRNLGLAVVVLGSMLLAEHGQARSAHRLHAKRDDRLLARIPPPPADCKSFFVEGVTDRPYETWDLIRVFYGPVTDAMMLAYRVGIPTLNGMSSIIPKEWEQIPPWGETYIPAVRSWIASHHLTGVCRLDLPARTWQVFAPAL